MTTPILDADGARVDHTTDRAVTVKRLLFDWSSIVALMAAAASWGVNNSRIDTMSREVERLRATNDIRATADVRIAETMATKADVQRVSDQVQRLAEELRNARAVR